MTDSRTRVLKTSSKTTYFHPPNVEATFSNFCSSLLETGRYSDFSVICGDRIWSTHKAILDRIEYFRKAIMSPFKVSCLPDTRYLPFSSVIHCVMDE